MLVRLNSFHLFRNRANKITNAHTLLIISLHVDRVSHGQVDTYKRVKVKVITVCAYTYYVYFQRHRKREYLFMGSRCVIMFFHIRLLTHFIIRTHMIKSATVLLLFYNTIIGNDC